MFTAKSFSARTEGVGMASEDAQSSRPKFQGDERVHGTVLEFSAGPLWKIKFVAYLPIPALADAAPHRQSVAARIATRFCTTALLAAFVGAHPPPRSPPCPRETAKRRCQIGASAASPSAGPLRPSRTRIRGLAE